MFGGDDFAMRLGLPQRRIQARTLPRETIWPISGYWGAQVDAREEIERLLGRVALSDRAAFAELYDRTSAKLYGVALRVLKDRSLAEDVLQETYAKIWSKAGRYRAGGPSPMSWLIAIARNTAIDRLRSVRAAAGDEAVAEDIPSAEPTPEAVAVARGEAGRVMSCLGELPEDRRRAVTGAYLDGLSYADLAARHDVPLNTMRTWLRRSLIALKECLSR